MDTRAPSARPFSLAPYKPIDNFRPAISETDRRKPFTFGNPRSDQRTLGGAFHEIIHFKPYWWQATTQANKRIEEISVQFKKELAGQAAELAAKAEELSQALGDITRLEKDLETVATESDEKTKALSQKDGEIISLKPNSRTKTKSQKPCSSVQSVLKRNLSF
jgi:hypothetical protein